MRFSPLELTRNGKIIHLVNDLVVYPDVCNMHCSYCMTTASVFGASAALQRKGGRIQWRTSGKERSYRDNGQLALDLDSLSDNYHRFFDAPVLKVSGGEILLIKNISRYLETECTRYESIQLLTNGTLLSPVIVEDLRKIANLHIQISLDGHTYAMNRLRVGTPVAHDNLMANLDRVARADIPVEVYCVLTRQNTRQIKSFADFLVDEYGAAVALTCFPVRHDAGKPFRVPRRHLRGVYDLIDDFDRYRRILPPLKYLQEMLRFLSAGETRDLRCMTPYVMIQTFNDGAITPCPYYWAVKTGDLLDAPEEAAASFASHPTYHMQTTARPWAPFCRHCWTDSAIYSLFFAGAISLEELCHNRPVLKGTRAQRRLNELKTLFSSKMQTEQQANEKGHAY